MCFGFFEMRKESFLISLIDRTAGLWKGIKQWGGKSLCHLVSSLRLIILNLKEDLSLEYIFSLKET